MIRRQKGALCLAAVFMLAFMCYGNVRGDGSAYGGGIQEEQDREQVDAVSDTEAEDAVFEEEFPGNENDEDENDKAENGGDKNDEDEDEENDQEAGEPKAAIRFLTEAAEIHGRSYFREVPDMVLSAAAPAGLASVEYRIEEEGYELLAEFPEEENPEELVETWEASLRETEAFAKLLAELGEGKHDWTIRVTDRNGVSAETEACFLLDRTAPVLSADYGGGILDEKCGKIFYREDALVRLMVTEEYLGDVLDETGSPVLPRVDADVQEGEGNVAEAWTVSDSGVWMELGFPASPEAGETLYGFSVTYQDGSGNLLEADETCLGTAEHGEYLNCPIVVDNKAPELLSFSIEGTSKGQIDGLEIYEHLEGADVTVSFTINDHAEYWDPSRVRLLIRNRVTGNTAVSVRGDELYWSTEGQSHSAAYGFDGEEGMGASGYEVVLCYEDRAGNPMIGRGEYKDCVTDGSYTSTAFLLDHQAPEFSISYGAAARLVREGSAEPSLDQTECAPQTGYTAYYAKDIPVRFSIREENARPVYEGTKLAGLEDLVLTVKGEHGKVYEPVIRWEQSEELYEGRFVLSAEDRYTILASYRDPSGNPMVFGRVEGSREEYPAAEDGSYESTELVLDRTAPVIWFSYVNQEGEEQEADAVHEREGRRYYRETIYLKLEAEDQNLRYHEILEILDKASISDLGGSPVPDSSAARFSESADHGRTASGRVVFYIPLATEAAYTFIVSCEDLAGNRAAGACEKVTVDGTCPELEPSCSVEKSGFLDMVRYQDIRYLFADSRMTIKVSALDQISGIRKIRCVIREEGGDAEEKTEILEPFLQGTREYQVPLEGTDFKGTITVELWDWSGNHTIWSDPCIVESAGKHGEVCRARIETLTEPGRTVGGTDYYPGDVSFRLLIEDPYSGLKRVSCTGGNTIEIRRDYTQEGLIHRYSEELVLEAAGNNENGVLVRAEYEDHAGHRGELEKQYHIDKTPPVLQIAYDQDAPADGGFYRQSRTAAIRVQERNFDPSDVEFLITSSEDCMPVIGEWESSGEGEETVHTCLVLFEEDSDYTFSVNVTDLAGNRTEYGQTDVFTIDRTAPVLTVAYDRENSDGSAYYAGSRTARIDLVEHNFDASLVHMTAEAEEGVPPSISGWSHEGDHHRALVSFAADGRYRLEITGMDRAGNEMEAYDTGSFVIDQTAPELLISGVEDRSANQGAVMPRILCSDRNYEEGSMEIRLEGCRHGVLDPMGTRQGEPGREEFRMEDFSYEPETDDLYHLSVRARDLAGNESLAEVLFSVNRFGSVYVPDERTELLAGRRGSYYTNTEPDIVITETNVDTLEFREITCSLNGELYTLEEGSDYSVEESGTEENWKQYVYRIPGRNFRREGIYTLTIYSEDRARNVSDNHAKGKVIEFAVDKTGPSILLSGLEDGGRYRERSREATLDVQDNLMTAEVRVLLNGVESVYHASEVQAQDGRITLQAGSGSQWQSIRVTAYDAAGNRQDLEERRFLITPNLFVQFFMNKRLFYGSMGGLLFAWAAAWHVLFPGALDTV